ncbi:hypothetical protein PHJA_000866900 [Phtheirospermum japonicum]|uniref:Uncharacterized protein n=1 Tax=Phtheirospermum japonicum TaxID=374723 RepID=A0A830BM34_9LAMI|nr:hypothetical protein PHJA_000866900 [Phtheirospermum japonicum]
MVLSRNHPFFPMDPMLRPFLTRSVKTTSSWPPYSSLSCRIYCRLFHPLPHHMRHGESSLDSVRVVLVPVLINLRENFIEWRSRIARSLNTFTM